MPHDVTVDLMGLFRRNIGLRGGPASVTIYDREVLLDAVLSGSIDPGRVVTAEFDLGDVRDAHEAMDERRAVESLLRVGRVRAARRGPSEWWTAPSAGRPAGRVAFRVKGSSSH